MTLEEIKRKLMNTIEAHQEEIYRIGDEILQNPELGYCEEKTSAFVRQELEKWGIAYDYPYALTGVKGKLCGREASANVCIIGEMDALGCAGSPIANGKGIAHACGHNAQMAACWARQSHLQTAACGTSGWGYHFFAAPAEEFID